MYPAAGHPAPVLVGEPRPRVLRGEVEVEVAASDLARGNRVNDDTANFRFMEGQRAVSRRIAKSLGSTSVERLRDLAAQSHTSMSGGPRCWYEFFALAPTRGNGLLEPVSLQVCMVHDDDLKVWGKLRRCIGDQLE